MPTRSPIDRLNKLSAVEIAAAVARGEATCVEVARACIDRILAREPVVQAWAAFDPDAVLAQARRLDVAGERGPLHGVPVGVKDVIDTFDMPTQMGSPIYKGFQPPADASCVAMLRAAGALILGKTVTCEFAGPAPAATTNPYDRARTPGGSSSGSAAAVADGMAALALGTQTGGSVLRPASYCGVVGFKPTFGLVNRAGVKPAAESLDTVGFFARTVEDVELGLRVLINAAAARWLAKEARLTVGLCQTPAWAAAHDSTHRAVLDAAAGIEAAGHRVVEIELPSKFGELSKTREIINDFERARAMAHEWRTSRELVSAALATSIVRGQTITPADYAAAVLHVERCRLILAGLVEGCDVLLAPAVSGEAEVGLASTGDHQFQSLWTQMHVPTISLPTHVGPSGMPVGVQLVGRRHGDAALLAHARFLLELLGQPALQEIRHD